MYNYGNYVDITGMCSARFNNNNLQTPKSNKSSKSGMTSSRMFSTNAFKYAQSNIKSGKSKGITVTSIDGKKKNKRVIQLPNMLMKGQNKDNKQKGNMIDSKVFTEKKLN